MKMNSLLIISIRCLIFIFVFVFVSCTADEKKSEFTVTFDSLLNEKHFIGRTESCMVYLSRFDSDLNRGILKYRNPCNFDPVNDIPLFDKLLTAVLKDEETDSLRALSWGRLTPDITKPSVLGRQLAVAASRSEAWDREKGRSLLIGENKFVRDLLNKNDVFAGLKGVFKKFGIKIQVTSVEKVLIFRAGELPDFNIFERSGIKKDDLIPIDCQIWIELKK